VTESQLQAHLMERAERLHAYVDRRIPFRLRRAMTSQDILQEVWIAAFRTASTFHNEGPDAIDRWLVTIVRSKLTSAIRHARRLRRDCRRELDLVEDERTGSYLALFSRLSGAGRTPSSEVAARDAVIAVQIALSALPADYQQAIALRHFQGRTNGEVAEAMNRTTGAVNSMLYRATLRLRKYLGAAEQYFSDVNPAPSNERSGAVTSG